MKTIFTIIIFSFSFFSFASSIGDYTSFTRELSDLTSFKPYKVIGVECVKGPEVYCQQISSGEFEGYWIKSNVEADSAEFNNIRNNMFTKAVLDKEIKTLDTTMLGLTAKLTQLKQTCEQIDSAEVEGAYRPSPVGPYKVVGVSCSPGDIYCELISSGPFKGYYMKSNMLPNNNDFNSIRPNMLTKAALDRERENRNQEIGDLTKKVSALEQSCGAQAAAETAAREAASESSGAGPTGIIH